MRRAAHTQLERHTRRIAIWFVLCGMMGLPLPAEEREPAKRPASAKMPGPDDVAVPPPDAIKTASGLAMKVLKTGSGTDHPAPDDCVVVTFTAWRRNGALYTASGPNGEPATQCLAVAIPGIAEALITMVPGDKRRVWVPAEMAYATHIAHHGDKMLHENPP